MTSDITCWDVHISFFKDEMWKATICSCLGKNVRNHLNIVEDKESSLKVKEMIGAVTAGISSVDYYPQYWWSKETASNRKKFNER